MGIAERKIRQKEEVRTGILHAAWKVVHEDGWQALSIRKIADAIEYSVPVIYDHFENKEAILSEFKNQGFQLMGDAILSEKEAHKSPEKQLEAMAYAYWDFAFNNKEYYQLMFGLGMPSCETARKIPGLVLFTDAVKSTIQTQIDTNELSADAFLKFHSFWSMLHGLVSINITWPSGGPEFMDKDDMNRMILKDFLQGFIKGLTK